MPVTYHPEIWERFIDELAATGSPLAAAEAVGVTVRGAYLKRTRDPEFGEKWATALAVKREALAGKVLELCNSMLDVPYTERKDTDGNVILDADGNPMMRPVLSDQEMSVLKTVAQKVIASADRAPSTKVAVINGPQAPQVLVAQEGGSVPLSERVEATLKLLECPASDETPGRVEEIEIVDTQ